MEINKLVSFMVKEVHSNKKNQDYKAIVLKIGEVEKVIAFLTNDQYKLIASSLK